MRWLCLKMLAKPRKTQWFCWSLSRFEKWLAIIGNINPTFSDIPRSYESVCHSNQPLQPMLQALPTSFRICPSAHLHHETVVPEGPTVGESKFETFELVHVGSCWFMLFPPFLLPLRGLHCIHCFHCFPICFPCSRPSNSSLWWLYLIAEHALIINKNNPSSKPTSNDNTW